MAKDKAKTEAPKVQEKKVESKWKAGKYKVLKTYMGSLGVYHAGQCYDMTAEVAEAFGKNGEIEPWLS